jgi:multiple sugar transport system ATP-binding protein
MAAITFDGVSKVFEDGTVAVADLHLEIADGEFLVLVGPSGCGKTTSLRMAAGLDDPTSGEIRIGPTVVNDVPSRSRDIAMVFQNYALYPHMSVLDNLAFGLRMRGVDKAERRAAAREVAEVLGITDLLDRQPKQLSGGQRQRVAMGRAIVRKPQAFLMDEPLSNLDAKLRVQMRAEIARIQRTLGTTTLYVTHDQVEAMTMADRVAVMRKGVLQQVAAPTEVYDRPANLFVAGFIGSPPMNLFEGRLRNTDDGVVCELGSARLAVPARPGLAELAGAEGRQVVVGIRPEDLEDPEFAPGAPQDRLLTVAVDLVEQLGSDVLVRGAIDAVAASGDQVADAAEGTQIARTEGAPLVARCNPRSHLARGSVVQLVVDTERIHLFDPVSGLALR